MAQGDPPGDSAPLSGDSGGEDDEPEICAVPICKLVKHPKGCDTKLWGLRYQDQTQARSDAMSARLLELATRPKERRRKVRRLKQDLFLSRSSGRRILFASD